MTSLGREPRPKALNPTPRATDLEEIAGTLPAAARPLVRMSDFCRARFGSDVRRLGPRLCITKYTSRPPKRKHFWPVTSFLAKRMWSLGLTAATALVPKRRRVGFTWMQ